MCGHINIESALIPKNPRLSVPASLDSGPVNVTINETSPASFRCTGSGDPKPTVTWYKGDSRLVSGGRVVIGENNLTISRSSRADAGWYSCNVSNGLGHDTAAAFLFVQGMCSMTGRTLYPISDLHRVLPCLAVRNYIIRFILYQTYTESYLVWQCVTI